MVHQSRSTRDEPITVDRALLERSEADLSKRVSPVVDQMIAALVDQHETEYELLSMLAEGKIYQFREYGEMYPNEVQRLISYGLIQDSPHPGIRMRQLHSKLLRIDAQKDFQANGSSTLSPGDKIEEWEVVDVIASGGYADVYRVISADGSEKAAAKIIRSGNLDSLQREVEVLGEISHKGIVRIIDTLRSEFGRPCLIMELIDGETLSKYCTPTKAPVTSVWYGWTLNLLNALEKLHPQERRARELEKSETMSATTYAEWTQAKHGYVHRDIKPENIIVSEKRGPVLIDFNISVRAGAPVQTVSSTNGYAPPLSVSWGTTTDIYALGVTLLELAAGNRLVNSSIDELKEQVEFRHPIQVGEILSLMLDSPNSGITASEVRKFLVKNRPSGI
ncbi:phosphotransferase [Glutamicibacter protophormiae]|uniref:serine/threonine protein kinase n=1 Tax=Glutamicibacter protophormiae TaxID=37930 RepID=UPI002A82B5E2|nr:phosphotransferase [Glutamicibacter protophormiae]WPR66271.1 phosphotransferase [Glutamicibacter protophormiae]WPR69768.1 phosphotransferase [Glutamicibacter protophormiae]